MLWLAWVTLAWISGTKKLPKEEVLGRSGQELRQALQMPGKSTSSSQALRHPVESSWVYVFLVKRNRPPNLRWLAWYTLAWVGIVRSGFV